MARELAILMMTAIVVLFAHTAAMFYPIGRGRYLREVGDLSPGGEFHGRTQTLKKTFFPWATYSLLLTIGLTTTGGASTVRGIGHGLHGALAILALFLNLFALWRGLVVLSRDLDLGVEIEAAAAPRQQGSPGG